MLQLVLVLVLVLRRLLSPCVSVGVCCGVRGRVVCLWCWFCWRVEVPLIFVALFVSVENGAGRVVVVVVVVE